MENFTPLSGLFGGLLIGAAATLFMLVNGRIAGISGILGGLFSGAAHEQPWRIAFIAGLILGPLAVAQISGNSPAINMTASLPVLIISGVLVGFGTRLGSGCTSGHGVCGLARGSARSIAATVTFFAVAAATVFVMRHLLGG